ncbi:PilZ domain-containing protein [Leisingera aquaemixtae]|uniref:PilZ domain-containing protein n=1 Tax=Leisingera aquaemixtae TaxID=1396826 RepID=UPI001C952231|nr:PilZ domain-containing protein [Leisingera aquaemixtae]MBY6065600.1 PilZ domain-containing protein [Leisingera aquaemixtae]
MVHTNALFRTAEPTEPRLRLNLSCAINLTGSVLQATLYNISYSGLAVRLPEEQSEFDLAQLKSVTIAEIGDLEVRARWRRDGKIGFKFLSKRGARPLLDAYFSRIGEYPT